MVHLLWKTTPQSISPLCQCKLKQWLEEHTRKHTRKGGKWLTEAGQCRNAITTHTHAVVDRRHGVPHMRGTDANTNASTATKRA